MSYTVTELKEVDATTLLTFNDLRVGDIFVILTGSEITFDAALFKKDKELSSFENATILMAKDLSQIGKKVSIDITRRVAKVTGIEARLSLALQREKV